MGWAAIACESGYAVAGHRMNPTVGRYLADAVAVGIGDINRAIVVHRDSFGLAEDGSKRRYTINAKVTSCDGLDGIGSSRRVGGRELYSNT